MRHIPVEAFEDTTRPNGGFVVIVLHGVDHAAGATSVRLKPLEAASLAERQTAQRLGRITPVLTRLSDRGLEVVLGPEVAGNPLLLAGTAVAIEVTGPEVRGEFLWPNVAPANVPRRRNVVVPARSRPRRRPAIAPGPTTNATAERRSGEPTDDSGDPGSPGQPAREAGGLNGHGTTAHADDTVVLEGVIEMPARRGAGVASQAAARMRGADPLISARPVGSNGAANDTAAQAPSPTAGSDRGAAAKPANGIAPATPTSTTSTPTPDAEPAPVALQPVLGATAADAPSTRESEPQSARGRAASHPSRAGRSRTAAPRQPAARGTAGRALAASAAIVVAGLGAWYYQTSDWSRAALPETIAQHLETAIAASRGLLGGASPEAGKASPTGLPPVAGGRAEPPGRPEATAAAIQPAGVAAATAVNCEPPAISTEPLPGGRAMLRIQAPCKRGEAVRINYGGAAQFRTLDAQGQTAHEVDLFAGDRAPIQVTFADGAQESRLVTGSDLDRVSKIALIWKAPVNLDLHVFEYAARRGEPGHVWSSAGGSFAASAAQATVTRRGHGFLATRSEGRSDGATPAGDFVEVYTFLHADEQALGALSIAVDYESRGDAPVEAFCGGGRLAEVPFRIVARTRGGLSEDSQGVLAGIPCGQRLGAADRLVPLALPPRLRR